MIDKPYPYRMGPLFDSVQLRHKWLNSLVHGRYNKLVFMGFVNQQTYHLRGTILPRDTVLFSESVMGHPPGPFTSMNDGFPMIHWVYPCNVSSFYRYEGIIMVFIHLGLLSGWWFGTFFPFSWECHHPNRRTHSIIFRGVGGSKPPTS